MRQLITTDSGRLSLTKFWSFVGCGVATWIVVYLTLKDKMTWEIFVAYLGSVGGFSQISKWLAYRYGVKTDVAATPKNDSVDSSIVEVKKCNDCPTPAGATVKPKLTDDEQPGD